MLSFTRKPIKANDILDKDIIATSIKTVTSLSYSCHKVPCYCDKIQIVSIFLSLSTFNIK